MRNTIVNQTNLYYYSYLVVSLWGNHKDVILGSGSFRGGAELEVLDLLVVTDCIRQHKIVKKVFSEIFSLHILFFRTVILNDDNLERMNAVSHHAENKSLNLGIRISWDLVLSAISYFCCVGKITYQYGINFFSIK